MSALDDVRRALTDAYGNGEIFHGLTADDLLRAVVADEQLAVSEALREAAADMDRRVQSGGYRARGLAYARKLLVERANGVVPEPSGQTRHADIAERLRAQPGVWLPVRDYPSRGSASSMAWQIRSGKGSIKVYRPGGAFDARTEPTADGIRVLACFVGADKDGA